MKNNMQTFYIDNIDTRPRIFCISEKSFHHIFEIQFECLDFREVYDPEIAQNPCIGNCNCNDFN